MLVRIEDPRRDPQRTDLDLASQGWERRFTADPQRAEEAMELYRQLGYEVRAEPASGAGETDECDACRAVIAREWKTIYTRRRLS